MTVRPRFLDEDDGPVAEAVSAPLGRPMLLEAEDGAPGRLDDLALARLPPPPDVRSGTGLLVACGLGGLIGSWAVFSAVSFVAGEYQVSPALGAGAGACMGASLLLLVWAFGVEWRAWRALARVDRLRLVLNANLADRDQVVAAGLDWLAAVRAPEVVGVDSALRAAVSAGEARALLRSRVADRLNAKALALGQRAAVECATLIAVCPHESLDGLIVGLRGLRLVRQVASLYGVRPGFVVTVSLIRHLGWTAAGTVGVTAVAENVASWAVTDAPVISHVAAAVSGTAFEAVRIIRLARLAARACCPLG